MSRIDYSKWDKLEVSDDDESVDGNVGAEQYNGGVHVTRLDAPSSVTFGGGKDEVRAVRPSSATTAPASTSSTQLSSLEQRPSQQQKSDTKAKVFPPVSWVDKGGSCHLKNGSQLFWSQDRYSVIVRFAIPNKETKNWVVQMHGNVSKFRDRHIAVSADRARLKIWKRATATSVDDNANSMPLLVDDVIPYPVHWEEGCGKNGDLDWSIERDVINSSEHEIAYLTVTLHKATPMAGLVLWWKRPLEQCPETTARFESDTTKAREFQQAWNEAHEQFLQKMEDKRA
ncbi:hypothetical protein ACA910_022361 [Epithemia clementina (nom. ined.)]